MNNQAFEILKAAENSWWNRGRSLVIDRFIRTARPGRSLIILDFGAGFGGLRETLSKFGEVEALEPDENARASYFMRGYKNVYGSLSDIKPGTHYDLIAACDVLEHIENDGAALLELSKLLAPDGLILISVPAYKFLWSKHDEEHGHFRRYTKTSLLRSLQAAGFKSIRATYWNSLMFPVAAIMRFLGMSGAGSLRGEGLVNRILFAVISAEAWLLKFMPLPFGLSIICLAEINHS